MPQRSQIGRRIRSLRLDQGRSQQDLAKAAGISPSYLNLIEHDRRGIGGGLLQTIATELGVDAAFLSTLPNSKKLERLEVAQRVGVEPAEAFADRFPGWAEVVTDQSRTISRLEAQIASLKDRMAHDPNLSAALHLVLSTVTSIRSTASILVDGAGDRDWEARFHQNIHNDSKRLADVSRALVAYLEAEPSDLAARSAIEEFAAFLDRRGHHIAEVEAGESPDVEELSDAAQGFAEPWFDQYRRDAEVLPLARVSQAAEETNYNPFEMARRLGNGLATVLRRLATLPPMRQMPAMGLAVCGGSGDVRHLKRIEGFTLSVDEAACPLWPLFQALLQPGRPIVEVVALGDDTAPRLTAYAIAEYDEAYRPDHPAVVTSTMLVVSDAPVGPVRYLGSSCGECRIDPCPARRTRMNTDAGLRL